MSPQVQELLVKGVGAPLLLGGIGGLLAFAILRLTHSAVAERTAVAAGIVGAVAGFSGAYLLLNGWPGFPPAARWQYLPFWGMLAGALAILEFAFLRSPTGRMESTWRTVVLWALRTGLVLAICWVSLSPLWNPYQMEPWSLGKRVAMIALYSGIALAAFAAVDRAARALPPFAFGAAIATWAGAASLIMLFGASANLGQLAGGIAAGVGAVVLVGAIPTARPALLGLGAVTVPIILGISIIGLHYDQALPAAVLLLPIVLVILGTGPSPKGQKERPAHVLTRLGAGAALLAAAILLGYQNYTGGLGEKTQDEEKFNYSDYYN